MFKKKIHIILAVTFAIIATSCSKDSDSSNSPVSASLVGTWKATAYSFEGRTTTIAPDDVSYYDFTGTGGLMDIDMVFSENPNDYILNGYYYLDNYIMTDEGDTYFYTDFNEFDDVGVWNIVGNVVNFTIIDQEFNGGIVELSDNTLVFRISRSVSETLSDGLTSITTTKNEIYSFERN